MQKKNFENTTKSVKSILDISLMLFCFSSIVLYFLPNYPNFVIHTISFPFSSNLPQYIINIIIHSIYLLLYLTIIISLLLKKHSSVFRYLLVFCLMLNSFSIKIWKFSWFIFIKYDISYGFGILVCVR